MMEQLSLPSWIATLSITLTISIFWSDRRARSMNFDRLVAMDILLRMLVGAFLGGRLFHVIYEQPRYYLQSPVEILKIWQGGFVFYGAFLMALVFAYWYCWRRRLNFLEWMNFFSPIFAFTYAFGRMGCFLNGCCYGYGTNVWWAVTFPQHHLYGIEVIPRHPTQLYAVATELIALGILILLEKKPFMRPPRLFALWLCLHSVGRILMEAFREDDRGPKILGFSIATVLSAIIFACGVTITLRSKTTSVSN